MFNDKKRDTLQDTIKSFAWALVLVLVIRTFLFEPFHIPSGSMLPNLLVGDYLFVSKYSYGYGRYSFPFDIPLVSKGRLWSGEAMRGDMIVFRPVHDHNRAYIKRVMAVAGDRIQVKSGRVFINGTQLDRTMLASSVTIDDKRYFATLYDEQNPSKRHYSIMELSDRAIFDSTPLYEVPAHSYFVMGDNRDSSRDSRDFSLVGFVPYENIIGRADMIFFSLAPADNFLEYLLFPLRIRYGRLFKDLS